MGGSIERTVTPAGGPAWHVTGHAEVKALLGDQRLGRGHPDPPRAPRYSEVDLAGRPASNSDHEYADHGRWRKAMNRVFSPRQLETLAPTVQDIADKVVTRMLATRPPANLNEVFSTPLASELMCEVLGIPTEDIELFRGWTEEGAQNTDISRSLVGIRALTMYTARAVKARRADPRDDVISNLLRAGENEGAKIPEGKVVKLVSGMLAFGRETPASLIDWGVMLLLSNPDQLRLLQQDEELRTGAVEEALRQFKPPAATDQGLQRYAHADIEVGDATIRAGEMVLLDVMAANHDPAVFEDPDRFDITRNPNPHMTFGYGFYMCNFTKLARIEMNIAVGTLLENVPSLRLNTPVTELEMRDHLRTGGLAELPVTW